MAFTAPPGGGGVTDHGVLTGLTDDDHSQYSLADGTRGPGAWTPLASVTADNDASVIFDSLIDSTFDTYVVLIEGSVPQTDAQRMTVQMLAASVDKGTTDVTQVTTGNDTGENLNETVYVYNPSSAVLTCLHVSLGAYMRDTGVALGAAIGGAATDQSEIDELVFAYESGNIVSGEYTLFGVNRTI